MLSLRPSPRRFVMADWPQPRSVLSVGTIPELLSLRAQVLYTAGFAVISATPEEASLRIGAGNYDVLLLCYSISDNWQMRLMRNFRERFPRGRVVAISNVPDARTPEEADECVYGIEGPEALINAVRGKAA